MDKKIIKFEVQNYSLYTNDALLECMLNQITKLSNIKYNGVEDISMFKKDLSVSLNLYEIAKVLIDRKDQLETEVASDKILLMMKSLNDIDKLN